MARVVSKNIVGERNVIDVEVDGAIYLSQNGMVHHNSKMCEHLWHTEGNIEKPKVYKLSELKPGYGDPKKEWVPTLNLSHFGCRHVLTFLLPGFGLDDSGKIVYKGIDPQTGLPHDEHSAQRQK